MNQKYVYIIGICGYAMSAIARWFKKNGYEVFGCDDCESKIFSQLSNEEIQIKLDSYNCEIPDKILQNKKNVFITHTTSIPDDHPKLKFFLENSFKIFSRKEIIQDITKEFFTISVTGTHGKTTTSSLLTHILYEGHCNLAGFLGGITKNYETNLVTYGNFQNPNIVIEADEYNKFFLCLKSNIAIVTNMDGDHYDVFQDFKNYKQSFKDFLANTKLHGIVILHKSVYKQLIDKNKDYDFYVDYYDIENAPVHAENISVDENNFYHFDYVSPKITITDLVLQIPGFHNINNALAVITAALYLKVNEYIIRESLRTFLGVKKRFDIVFANGKNIVIDDYAHHPTEIAAVVNTVKKIYSGKKITLIFRPNQYSRTQNFLQQFSKSLDLADQVIVLDIFTDREEPITGISNQSIIENMKIKAKIACAPEDLLEALAKFNEHEIVINLGAGDSETFVNSIIDYLQK
ncbi:MAG: UDP-N-acetylmuramate--L-alanine ligase [Cytophagales bacterium]|jgi:UDP-N-acetylmuramate--alanine ligase|nr:UDP-N-acetylmuramate--L-alanine ligase [Cytophagales bacterium]